MRVLELDPLVITGTRISRQKSEIPASISVVNRNDIDNNGHTNILPLLANRVPGLFLNERNMVGYGVGPGSGGNISIRGVSGTPNTQILMLIDGQPQFMGIFGHPIADAYTSSDIEKVEVIRGPASVLYGSNAMGGAINLITRQPQEGLTAQGIYAYGSYHTMKFTEYVSYSRNKLNIMGSFNRESTDGARKDADDAFKNLTGYLKFDYQLSKHINLVLDGNLADATFQNPGQVGMPAPADSTRDYTRGRSGFALENRFDKVEGALKFFYNFGKHQFSDGFNSSDYNYGITFYQNLKLFSGNVVTLGMDGKSFGGKPTNQNTPEGIPGGFDVTYDIQETDLYLLFQQNLLKRLSLNLGYRFVINSMYGNEHVPTAGMAYNFNPQTNLKISASKGFRSPAVIDLFLFPTSNDRLEPESIWNYELIFGKSFMDGRFNFELTGFLLDGENMIQELIVTAPPPVKQNSGSFINKGIEFSTDLRINKSAEVLMNYTWLTTSKELKYAPEHELNLQGIYRIRSLTANIGYKYVHGLYTSVDPNNLVKDNYSLLNIKLKYMAAKWVSIFVEANNILNQDYEIDYGYPLPGFNAIGGLEFRYHKD